MTYLDFYYVTKMIIDINELEKRVLKLNDPIKELNEQISALLDAIDTVNKLVDKK